MLKDNKLLQRNVEELGSVRLTYYPDATLLIYFSTGVRLLARQKGGDEEGRRVQQTSVRGSPIPKYILKPFPIF